jgi:hypothetical protein
VQAIAAPSCGWPENVKIAKASSDQRNSSDANVKTMADKQASIILEGTMDLSSGTNNLTLNVDPTSGVRAWGSSRARLAPGRAPPVD